MSSVKVEGTSAIDAERTRSAIERSLFASCLRAETVVNQLYAVGRNETTNDAVAKSVLTNELRQVERRVAT